MRGSLEAQVLKVLWSTRNPLYVRDVLNHLNQHRENPLAYTTVMTVMNRLMHKGAVTRRRQGRCYAYRPTSSDAAGLAVRRVLTTHGAAAVWHFVGQATADPALRQRLHDALTNRLRPTRRTA
jgi:predicted transcriptional regulator